MTKTKCRPCITISTIWKLAKIHFRHFMEDIRAFNEVQEYSCAIHYSENHVIPSTELKKITKIREIAAVNYKEPPKVELPTEVQNKINEVDKMIDEALSDHRKTIEEQKRVDSNNSALINLILKGSK